jgi:hypothetical protein
MSIAVAGAVPAGAVSKKKDAQFVQAGLSAQTVRTPYRPRNCGWNPAMRNPQVFARQEARGCFSQH